MNVAEEKKEGLPKINGKFVKHSSSQRLERIKSEQSIMHQNN